MDFDVAHWTILACLQVFHNTTFTEGVQTLCNCCGIYEVPRTKVADNVFVQVLYLQFDLLLVPQRVQFVDGL